MKQGKFDKYLIRTALVLSSLALIKVLFFL